jgi:hypothetical protein
MKATRYARRIAVLPLIAVAALTTSAAAQMHGGHNDDDAIRQVVQSAYIEGLHMNAGHDQVRAGFHPEFVMFVRSDDGVRRVTIEEWISRLPPEGTVPSREATADIQVLSREGNAAAVRAEVYFDGEHVYTDFFLLYAVEGSWRIVGKTFQSHR